MFRKLLFKPNIPKFVISSIKDCSEMQALRRELESQQTILCYSLNFDIDITSIINQWFSVYGLKVPVKFSKQRNTCRPHETNVKDVKYKDALNSARFFLRLTCFGSGFKTRETEYTIVLSIHYDNRKHFNRYLKGRFQTPLLPIG